MKEKACRNNPPYQKNRTSRTPDEIIQGKKPAKGAPRSDNCQRREAPEHAKPLVAAFFEPLSGD